MIEGLQGTIMTVMIGGEVFMTRRLIMIMTDAGTIMTDPVLEKTEDATRRMGAPSTRGPPGTEMAVGCAKIVHGGTGRWALTENGQRPLVFSFRIYWSWSRRKFGVDVYANGVYFSTWSIPLVLTANPLNYEDPILRLHPLGMAQLDSWTIGRQQALGQSASTCEWTHCVCAHKPP